MTVDDWSIVPYDRSTYKTAQDILFQAARESNEEKAEEKWEKFLTHTKHERLSHEQIKVLIDSFDSRRQWTPLHYAVEANNMFIFSKLTSGDKFYRCDININGGNGENVLHIAAQSNKIWESKPEYNLPKIVQEMLDYRADIHDRDNEGRTPLHLAVQNNRYNYAIKLISCGADIMATSKFQESVLHFALIPNRATSEELKKMIALIKTSAEDITQKKMLIQMATLHNHTPLAYALCHPSVTESIINELFIKDDQIDDKQFLIAFDALASHVHRKPEEFNYLNPILDWCNHGYSMTLKQLPHIFCRHNNVSLLKWFDEKYSKVNTLDYEQISIYNTVDSAGYTPLLTAVFYKATECVNLILDRMLNINVKFLLLTNDNNENILHICAKCCVEESLFHLIWNNLSDTYGVKKELVYMTDIEENTPLQVAARFSNKHMCKELLNYIQTDCSKSEAAHEASKAGYLDILKLSFKYDSDKKQSQMPLNQIREILNMRDKYGYTCVHAAAEQGYKEIAEFLIKEMRSEVDPIDERRRTPLHIACEKGHMEIVQFLLETNASTTLRNAQVYNCLEIAIIHQQKDIVQELFKHSTWKEMMRNAQPIDNTEAFDTPMRKLIRYMPDIAVWLIDNKLTRIIGGPGEKIYKTIYDYEFYEDMFKVKDWYTQNAKLNLEPPTCASLWRTRGVEAIHTCWCCCHSNNRGWCSCYRTIKKTENEEWYTNDAYTLVRNHPLFIVSQQTHSPEIVQHFYHTYLRQTKLRSFGLAFFILSYFMYMAYLGLYTAVILMGKHPKYFYDQAQVNLTMDLSTCEFVSNYLINNANVANEGLKSDTYKRLKWTLYAILIMFITKNLITIAALFPKVLRIGGSYVEILALLLSYLYVLDWKDWQNDVILRCPVQYQIGAMGLLLSYINLLMYLRTSPVFDMGIYIVMLQVISVKFLRFLPVFLTLICGFGFTYWMLLQYQAVYGTPIEALLRTSFMLFDLGYEDRLYDEENGGVGYYKLVYVMFALTAIVCSIFVINLLIGLAVGEIPTLLTQGTLWRIQILFNLLSDYEMLRVRFVLIFDCLTCNVFRQSRIPWFRPRPCYILEKDELKSPMLALGDAWNYTQKYFFNEQIQDNIKPPVESINKKY
ncbi:hypothetical protein I4U23_004059 [Adineta vaga]|nr:hypothetical protein I4U23_004059 [Adineta vaga]